MLTYKDGKGDLWVEIAYRSGYGFAHSHHNVSKEARASGNIIENIIDTYELCDNMSYEDNIGSN